MRPAFVVAAAVALVACGDGVPKPPEMVPATEEEAAAVARDFIASASPCDREKLGALFDSDNVARRAANKAKLRPDLKREILKELGRRQFSVALQLCTGFPADVRFELLRVRQIGAVHRPLLRMVGGGTFNYFDLEVAKRKSGGEPRVVDMLDFYSGNQLSDIVAEGMGVGAQSAMRGEQFNPQEIAAARAAGEWQTVRDLVQAMPPKVRASRIFRLAELQAAMQLEDPAYVDLVTAFEKDFPDDPSLLMLVIDGHVMRKDVDALLLALDRLERKVGGDPYLDTHRAGAYLLDPENANLNKAEQLARSATTAVPDVADGWWILATIQQQRGDTAALATTADEIKRRFGIDFPTSP